MADLRFAALLFVPLLGGSLLHGLASYFGWFRGLLVPVDGGACLRGRPLFGANKTWRGILMPALGTAVGCVLVSRVPGLAIPELSGLPLAGAALFGFGFGAGAMLSELPNSLVKRQLGLGAGEAASGLAGVLSYVVDQIDLVVGCWLVAALLVSPTAGQVFASLVVAFAFHHVVTVIGYLTGVRNSLR